MGKIIKISDDVIKGIADKYSIDENVLHVINNEIELYANYLHDSLQEFKRSPDLKYDDFAWKIAPIERAKISQYYHNNKEALDSTEPNLVDSVGFYIHTKKIPELKLSHFVANDILKTYIEKLIGFDLLLDNDAADAIVEYNERPGKRESDYTIKRNNMILLAVYTLKRHGIHDYANIIIELFSHLGYKGLSKNNLYKIVRTSK